MDKGAKTTGSIILITLLVVFLAHREALLLMLGILMATPVAIIIFNITKAKEIN